VVDPILKEVDEWDSWATMKDTAEKGSDGLQQLHGNLQDAAESEEDEETDAASQKKQGRVSRYLQEADSRKEVEALKEHLALKDSAVEESNVALEDDPRAVHVPAAMNTASDDSSELLGSAFGQMGLSVELCRALKEMNINTPTPIQKASLPVSLAGESVLLCAETGSGKSR
jgi:superfamily II RNA helicase